MDHRITVEIDRLERLIRLDENCCNQMQQMLIQESTINSQKEHTLPLNILPLNLLESSLNQSHSQLQYLSPSFYPYFSTQNMFVRNKISKINKEQLKRLQSKKVATQSTTKRKKTTQRNKDQSKKLLTTQVNSSTKKLQPKKLLKLQPQSKPAAKKITRINLMKFEQNHQKATICKNKRSNIPKTNQKQNNVQQQQMSLLSRINRFYVLKSGKMTADYLLQLSRQCRQPTQQAILKMKVLSLVVVALRRVQKAVPYTVLQQDELLQVLATDTFLQTVHCLPSTLRRQNVSQVREGLNERLTAIDEELEQELGLFLIKTTPLYQYAHALVEYVRQANEYYIKQLESREGYYSSRSRKGGRKKDRCDTERKITHQDTQFKRKKYL